ncbi:DNA-directed DNA polymerase [Quaeritorhiza haematococci]|nr:DNA-directed DNA polymerase [Quaeritorhiza haematococci]
MAASTTLNYYWDLASLDAAVRMHAAENLLEALNKFQSDHQQASGLKEDRFREAAKTEKEIEELCAADVSYGLKRLIRGLPSSRDGARQGFALVLTELLGRLEFVTVATVMDMIIKSSDITGSMKGKEERDMYFGRLFGLMAITQSGMLLRSHTTLADIQRMITCLCEYATAKSYLTETCFHVVISILNRIESRTDIHSEACEFAVQTVLNDGVATPEELWFAILMQQKCPTLPQWSSALKSWKNTSILHPSNKAKLVEILKESSHTHPHVHSVWEVLIDILLGSNQTRDSIASADAEKRQDEQKQGKKNKKNKKAKEAETEKKDVQAPAQISLQDLWTVLDETLFTSSHERKYLGFQLFQRLLPRMASSSEQHRNSIPFLFSPNFFRCFVNNLSTHDNYLYKAASQTAKVLLSVAEEHQIVAFQMVLQLVNKGKGAVQHFDRVTKTKTVETLMGSLDAAGVYNYVKYLIDLFVDQSRFLESESDDANPSSSSRDIDTHRIWALDQLLLLVRNHKLPRDDNDRWLTALTQFLCIHGLLKSQLPPSQNATEDKELEFVRKSPVPPVSNAVREHCRDRFFGVLGELNNHAAAAKKQKDDGAAAEDLAAATTNGKSWAYGFVQFINTVKVAQPKDDDGDEEMDDADSEVDGESVRKEVNEIVDKVHARIEKLVKEGHKSADEGSMLSKLRAIESLFCHLMLQLEAEETEDNLSTLKEVADCYHRLFEETAPAAAKTPNGRHNHKHSHSESDSDEEEDEDLNPYDVLLDILMALLSKPSAWLRSVVEQTFKAFCSGITKKGIDLIFEVLQAKGNGSGNGEDDIFEQGDDEEGEDGEGDDDEEEGEKEDDESDDDDDDEGEELSEEQKTLIQAMLNARAGKGGDGSDDEDDEEELSDLDDDQMEDFDAKLAEIFKHRKQLKTDKKVTRQQIWHFKLRVVDLIEIFVRKQSSSPLILDLAVSLLRMTLRASSSSATESTTTVTEQKQLGDKLTAILRNKLCKAKEVPRPASKDDQEFVSKALGALEEVHSVAGKEAGNKAMLGLCSGVSLLIVRMLSTELATPVVETPAPNAEKGKKNKKRKAEEQQKAPTTVTNAPLNWTATSILSTYRKSLTSMMTVKRTTFQPAFFVDFGARYPELGWRLMLPVEAEQGANKTKKKKTEDGEEDAEQTSQGLLGLLSLDKVAKPYRLVQGAFIMSRLFNMIPQKADDRLKSLVREAIPTLSKDFIALLRTILDTPATQTQKQTPVKSKPNKNKKRKKGDDDEDEDDDEMEVDEEGAAGKAESGLPPARVKEVLKMVLAMARKSMKMFEKDEWRSLWQSADFVETVQELSGKPSFESPVMKQLVSLFGEAGKSS